MTQSENNNYKKDNNIPNIYKSYMYIIDAPEGKIEICILEDINTNKAVGILGHCGKSGTIVMAWMDAFCRIVSRQMEKGAISIYDLKEELASTTSSESKINHVTKVRVSSGPEAIFIALTRYTNDKYDELRDTLGMDKEIARQAYIDGG